MPPLALTNAQLATIQTLAAPLHPRDRGPFLERVAERLRGFESLGDGLVTRIAREAQREFFKPPNLNGAARWE
jgi:hypothetical protein